MTPENRNIPAELRERMENREIIRQKCWKFIREMNSFSEERLDSAALRNGKREYTYRQMFRRIDRYAEVFSALGITGKNRARAALVSMACVEPIIAFFALNMTGTSVSMLPELDYFDPDSLKRIVEEEGITDLVVPDIMMPAAYFRKIMKAKEEIGLRHVIILDCVMSESATLRIIMNFARMNRRNLNRLPGTMFMKDLLVRYEAYPISYGTRPDNTAVILHTSGTTRGIHKPVPLSDAGLNEAVLRVLLLEEYEFLHGNVRTMLNLSLATSYAFLDMMLLPLAAGGSVMTLMIAHMNPALATIFKKYDINVFFSTTVMLDMLEKNARGADLSGIDLFFLGGSYISPEAKKRYDALVKRLGMKHGVSIGYGLSEVGGACIIAPPDRQDDSIGFPLPGVNVRIQDEEDGTFHTLEEGPRTGVLFLSSLSVSGGRIGRKVFFKTDKIEGETYYNTHDLVEVKEDGSLAYAGRMNSYFVNNEGIRFDAGLVETAVSAQPGIVSCALAPEYDKVIHDTVPVLYVQTGTDDPDRTGTVRRALTEVFINTDRFSVTNMPSCCVLTDSIPRNAAGKVDVRRVISGEAEGERYSVTPVKTEGRLTNILLQPTGTGIFARSGMPDELETDFSKVMDVVKLYLPGGLRRNNSFCHNKTNMNNQEDRSMMMQLLRVLQEMNQQQNTGYNRVPQDQQNMGYNQMPQDQQNMGYSQMPYNQQQFMGYNQMPQDRQYMGYSQMPSMQQFQPFAVVDQNIRMTIQFLQNILAQHEQMRTQFGRPMQPPFGMGCGQMGAAADPAAEESGEDTDDEESSGEEDAQAEQDGSGMQMTGCGPLQGMAADPGSMPPMGCGSGQAAGQPGMMQLDPMRIMNSQVYELLGRLFQASTTDYFYED